MKINIPISIICLFFFVHSHASINGHWQLIITGKDNLEYGTEYIAAGVQIEWRTEMDFTIARGQFDSGTGVAKLNEGVRFLSRPPGLFSCQLSNGVFANRNGVSFSTPHLRYKAFPVGGKVKDNEVILQPFLDYPGNYFAVLYHCETDDEAGLAWFERSPRIAREMNKQQNTNTEFADGIYRADVKEVKRIPPGSRIEIPLVDGFHFSVTDLAGSRVVDYRLLKIED